MFGADKYQKRKKWTRSRALCVIITEIYLNAPQTSVAGHCFGFGFVSGSQLEVLQVTLPGFPDDPAPTPHLVAHPVG